MDYKTNGRAKTVQSDETKNDMKAVSEIRKEHRREARGERTRQEILQRAVNLASAEGLEGLTIGRLAQELGMSKSGLFAHFGSKEELQIAVIGKARDIFVREVVDPAFASERGLPRLRAMLDEWISYVGRSVFRGGCFFMACAIEFDSRPGEVRDLIAELSRSWLTALEEEIRYAQSSGQFDAKADAAQLAFELHAMAHQSNWAYQLFDDKRAFERARAGILNRLQAGATASGLKLLISKPSSRKKASPKKAR
ncbi:MAG TPA: TetR/AcrR family transcriptional regulator [Blastocatellia bacterium]